VRVAVSVDDEKAHHHDRIPDLRCRMTTWHPTGIKLACADYESRIKLPPPAITAVHFEADGVALVPYTADEIAKVLAND